MEKDQIRLFEEILNESQKLMEMSTVRKKSSGLPVNIYLDDSMSYLRGKHSKRIKFQTDTGDKPITGSFSSMLLDGTIPKDHKYSLASKDINDVKQFVLNNKIAIEALADMNIEIDDFKKIMIRGGEPATEEQKKKLLKDLSEAISTNYTEGGDI